MKRRLYALALVTLVGFPALGWTVLGFFEDEPLQIIFRSEYSLLMQVILGLPIGVVAGLMAKWIISRPRWQKVGIKYARIISRFGLSTTGIWFISFCAGVGEELLFRGALQPLMGIWLTAFVFVAIHGYLDPRNRELFIYGIFMTITIAGLGYLVEYIGIWTAAIAHMMIDVILFYHLTGLNTDNSHQ